MTTTLNPQPVFRGFDNNGNPLASGKLFTYQAGTTTKLATYTDSTGSTPNSNPLILNARGEGQVWIPPNVAYKQVLAPSTDTDPPTSPIWTVDNIVNSQLITLFGGVDTGSVNAYVINFIANFTAYTDGIIIYWIPASTNTGPSTINVNGLGVVNILNQNGSALSSNQLLSNSTACIIYRGGSFYLLFSGAGFPGLTIDSSFNIYALGVALVKAKSATTARSTNIVLSADPDLVLSLKASSTYAIEGFVNFNNASVSGAGLQWNFSYSGTLSNSGIAYQGIVNAASGASTTPQAAATARAYANIAISALGDWIYIAGFVKTSSVGSLSFQWCQNSSNAAATQVFAGSYLKATQVA